MKYNLNWVKQRFNEMDNLKYIFFWGHKPRKDGQISATCFSQWWLGTFTVEGISYPSAEHWMMAGKARLFKDDEMLAKILVAKTPGAAKKLGRKVRGFDGVVWNKHKYDLVKQGNIHKFGQDEALKTFLLNTGNRVLVEASPYDKIWGIGLSKNAKNVENPNTWRGENLLRFALMEARDVLREM